MSSSLRQPSFRVEKGLTYISKLNWTSPSTEARFAVEEQITLRFPLIPTTEPDSGGKQHKTTVKSELRKALLPVGSVVHIEYGRARIKTDSMKLITVCTS
ncbi:hypothetical protein RJ641_005283 [Dillenia turbinata]|uniref:Uncharacterized protein n=1 Tax=Dillenia turbinata TaxID=194707 RepID=A0AAN8V627_9MAGN